MVNHQSFKRGRLVKERKKTSLIRNLTFWAAVLLLIAALTAGWLLWRGLYSVSPRFNFLLVSVNHEPQKILSGETLHLHPKDNVKVLTISTNMLSNLGIRLVSQGFDVSALRHEEMIVSALLPDQEIFNRYFFRIWIKYRNQELGYMDWQVQPRVEDWLDKANRTINDDQRLVILQHATQLLPEDRQLRLRLLKEYRSLKRWKQLAPMLEEIAEKKVDQEILTDLLKVYTAMEKKDGIVSVLKRLVELNPNDLEAHNQLAEIFEESGKLKEAIIEYEGLLGRSDEKDRLPIYNRLGYLYTKIGGFEKAVSFYLKAEELDKKDANLYYNLSYLYEKIGQKEKVDFYLGRAVSLKSKDMEGRLRLAESLINKNSLKEAGEYLSEVLKEKPKSLEALVLMARVLEKRGEKQELKKIYRRVLSLEPKNEAVMFNLGILEYETGDLKASSNYFTTYLRSRPKDAAAHEILFDIYKKQNNTKSALREARILVDLRPKEIGPYYYLFDHLSAQRDYENIIRVMEKGLKANPEQMHFKKYLALAHLKTGEGLKKAKKYLSEVLKEEPKSLEALVLMAQVLEKRGEKRELKKIYKRILSLEPKNETVMFNLGALEYETGDLKASLNYFTTYLKSRPKDAAAHEIIFDIYKKQKNAKLALSEAQILIELRPKETGPYHYIFDRLSARGDYERIIRIMLKGLEVNPEQTDFRGYLVLAYLETGKEEAAIEHIEEILKVRPEDIKLLLHLARLREKRGENGKALEIYKKIIEIMPDHEEAEEAYLRLRVRGVQSELGQ